MTVASEGAVRSYAKRDRLPQVITAGDLNHFQSAVSSAAVDEATDPAVAEATDSSLCLGARHLS